MFAVPQTMFVTRQCGFVSPLSFVLRLIGQTSGLFYCKLSFTFTRVAEVTKGKTVRGRRSETRQDQKRCQEHGIAVSQRQLLRLGCKACSLIHTLQAVDNSIRVVPIKLASVTPWGSRSSRCDIAYYNRNFPTFRQKVLFQYSVVKICMLTTDTASSYETYVNLRKTLGATSQNILTLHSMQREIQISYSSHLT